MPSTSTDVMDPQLESQVDQLRDVKSFIEFQEQ